MRSVRVAAAAATAVVAALLPISRGFDARAQAPSASCPPGMTFVADAVGGRCDCAAGTRWDARARRCVDPECGGGTVFSQAHGSCACPDGTAWSRRSHRCVEASCTGGTLFNRSTGNCECAGNASWATRAERCVECTGGAVFDPSSEGCMCTGGTEWSGSACTCPASTPLFEQGQCSACPSNFAWNGSACACPASLPVWLEQDGVRTCMTVAERDLRIEQIQLAALQRQREQEAERQRLALEERMRREEERIAREEARAARRERWRTVGMALSAVSAGVAQGYANYQAQQAQLNQMLQDAQAQRAQQQAQFDQQNQAMQQRLAELQRVRDQQAEAARRQLEEVQRQQQEVARSAQAPAQPPPQQPPPAPQGTPRAQSPTTPSDTEPAAPTRAEHAGNIYQFCSDVFYDPNHYNWLAVRNGCNEALHVTFRFADGNGGATDVAPGGHASTGYSREEVERHGGLPTLATCRVGYSPIDADRRPWSGGMYKCREQ